MLKSRNSRCSSAAPCREQSLRGHQLDIGVFVALNGIKPDTLRNIISDFTDGDKEVFPRDCDGITRAHLATQDISDHFRLLQIILSVKCAARILRAIDIYTEFHQSFRFTRNWRSRVFSQIKTSSNTCSNSIFTCVSQK